MTMIALLGFSAMGWVQDVPTDIAKKDLPKLAKCLVCTGEGDEKPAGGVMYKGKTYYFCNTGEIKNFKKDPEAFIPPELPRPMPEFSIKDQSGKLWDAETMKGRLVLVDYWATWCGPCIAMFPTMEKLYKEFSGPRFEMLSVSVDKNKTEFVRFLNKHSFANPVLHDSAKTFEKWNVKFIPALFLLKDGQIVWQGGTTSEKDLRLAIKANLP